MTQITKTSGVAKQKKRKAIYVSVTPPVPDQDKGTEAHKVSKKTSKDVKSANAQINKAPPGVRGVNRSGVGSQATPTYKIKSKHTGTAWSNSQKGEKHANMQ